MIYAQIKFNANNFFLSILLFGLKLFLCCNGDGCKKLLWTFWGFCFLPMTESKNVVKTLRLLIGQVTDDLKRTMNDFVKNEPRMDCGTFGITLMPILSN